MKRNHTLTRNIVGQNIVVKVKNCQVVFTINFETNNVTPSRDNLKEDSVQHTFNTHTYKTLKRSLTALESGDT